MEELRVENLEQIRYMKIRESVWKRIAKKMNMTHYKLQIHWDFKLYTQLFAQDRLCWDELRLQLYEL